MDIKHREIMHWLQEIYGSEQIPPFEKTERSLNLLHRLMLASTQAEGNAKVLVQDYTNKTAEYNAEGRQYSKWLEGVNIKPTILSEESQKALSALAQTAQVLDVRSPTSSNIILGANQLETEHMQLVNEQEQEKGRTCQLLEMSKDLSWKLNEINSIEMQAETTWTQQQQDLARDKKQEFFVKEKCKNYATDINFYKAKLNQVGISENIKHDTLCKQYAVVQDLEKQVQSLESKLRSYSLPPDMTLAEVKVEEARQELASIMNSVAAACKIDQ